jgi:RimJ/RimL family protein N-acetyltransferase
MCVKVIIEEFTEKDADELEDVFRKVWTVSYEYPEKWRKARQLSRDEIIQEMRSGYHFFGARNQEGITGVYKLVIKDEGCFGEHQSILPSYTGKGVASAMYEQFIQYAKENGCTRNFVYILETHTACIHLVKKFGFSPVGDTFEQAERMSVQEYERLCYE